MAIVRSRKPISSSADEPTLRGHACCRAHRDLGARHARGGADAGARQASPGPSVHPPSSSRYLPPRRVRSRILGVPSPSYDANATGRTRRPGCALSDCPGETPNSASLMVGATERRTHVALSRGVGVLDGQGPVAELTAVPLTFSERAAGRTQTTRCSASSTACHQCALGQERVRANGKRRGSSPLPAAPRRWRVSV